jgi:hypothetical protein
MMSLHLSDEELQMVASGQQDADTTTTRHIESCALCQEQLAVYKLIVSTIKEQPKAAFNFDLAEAVLQQLQPAPAKKAFSLRPVIIAAFIAIPFYLFRKNFLLLTTGISTAFLLLSVITCIIIIGFNIFKLYHTYERQIEQLNISE